ncbi:MAG: deoxyribodipyrimidine photo-lyase [Gammaproteobacteria bacterium]|jgi:deoxyribodipyrimidine photo-lyase
MLHADRIQFLNDAPVHADGRYVLYWMQQSQRVGFNPSLQYAIKRANEIDRPVVVAFGLFADYPEANERHFAFMLEGLADVAVQLREQGIKFVVRCGRPDEVCLRLAGHAALVVCDRGYLKHQVAWRKVVARDAGRQVVQVEGDVVVPVENASHKREFAARTIRPKISRLLDSFLDKDDELCAQRSSLRLRVESDVDVCDTDAVLAGLKVDRSVARVERFHGGSNEAQRRLDRFLHEGLSGYGSARNDPASPQCSNLSPYLHFGQISAVDIVLNARAARGASVDDHAVFVEELVVRRELAINFVHFDPDYDRYKCLPPWARETLDRHRSDKRDVTYTRKELEAAETHDPYWNAAMNEMLRTGYMHNYMRMYWGKKVIEWSNTPQNAFRRLLAMNNKYFIDGRDPNSYCGVGWIFGLHDRAWARRPVFGTIRYMNAKGLERKFDINAYVGWTEQLTC